MIQKENISIIKEKLNIFDNNACHSHGRGTHFCLSETRACRKLGSPTYLLKQISKLDMWSLMKHATLCWVCWGQGNNRTQWWKEWWQWCCVELLCI